MTRRGWMLLGAGLALGVGGALRADGKADAVLAKASQAAAQAKSLQADLEIRVARGEQTSSLRAVARLLKPNLGHLKITRADGYSQIAASDGKTLVRALENEKQYLRTPIQPKGENFPALGHAAASPITAFFTPEALSTEGERTYRGAEKVGDQSYEVVEVAAPKPPQARKLYFGATGLLEGAELKYTGAGAAQTVTMWLKNVRLDAPLEPGQLAYAPPSDFKVLDVENPGGNLLPVGQAAPDFQLPTPTGGRLALSDVRKGKKAVLVNFWFYG